MPRMPEDMAARYGTILEEYDASIKLLNDSKADTLTDLRGELKALGYQGAEIGAEVAMLKAAVKQIGMTQVERQKADDKDEGVSDYVTILSLARARAHEADDDGVVEHITHPAPVSSPGAEAQPIPLGAPAETVTRPAVSADIQPDAPALAAQTGPDAPAPSSLPEREAVESSGLTNGLTEPACAEDAQPANIKSVPSSQAGSAAGKSGSSGISPALPAPPNGKRWTFNDPAHPDCLDTDRCGGFSNLGLCPRCKAAAGPVVHVEAETQETLH